MEGRTSGETSLPSPAPIVVLLRPAEGDAEEELVESGEDHVEDDNDPVHAAHEYGSLGRFLGDAAPVALDAQVVALEEDIGLEAPTGPEEKAAGLGATEAAELADTDIDNRSCHRRS